MEEGPRRGGRPKPAVYRRRRLAALAVLAALILAVALAFRGGGEELTPAQEKRAERALEPVRFTVSVSGDILIHSLLWEQALANGGGANYDFAPFFAELRPYVAGADLALCHLETPMTFDASEVPASYPVFDTPPELADGIRASGWDVCNTASNHSLDQGQEGIDETGAILDRAGIEHTGSFDSARERDRPLVLEVKGVRLGFIAYTDATNGIPPPEPWSVNVAAVDDPAKAKAKQILADAGRARRAGAEAVILNMHWGDENALEPNDSQLELARQLTKSRLITVIVGQGPHVVGPIERVNRKFVVFSEGNLVSNQSALAGLPTETQYGFVALLRFIADEAGVRVQRIDYVPTWVRLDDYVVLPAGDGIEEDPANSAALRDAYESVVGIAGRGKGITPIPPQLPPG
jgi:poly-gamma-glutamate capsule biosynthesis protein CapA/YwtB (metallophosphatase superfamily)